MRLPSVLDPDLIPAAERCAMRLDGDCFDLGLGAVTADAVVGAEERAATLRPAALRHGLVVDTWAAAWVHGAVPALPTPPTLSVDLDRGRALRSMRPMPREARFGEGEVVLLGGVRVTSALKTAFDLLLRHGDAVDEIALALLQRSGLEPDGVAAAIAAMPKHNGKHRIAARARALLLGGSQPADTR